MARPRAVLPAELIGAARRFERWRSKRTTRQIPEELWSLAAELGSQFGVSRTSRALGVGYQGLKKRVVAPKPSATTAVTPQAFVEIRTSRALLERAGSCQVEFERTSGEKMRVQLGSGCEADLSRLTRLFLGEAR